MFSIPPAMRTDAWSRRIMFIPMPTAVRAEQQALSTVKAFVATGSFAARTACRAGESPTPGRQSPSTTPSMSPSPTGRPSITFRMAIPPSAKEGMSRKDPPKRPKGVLFPLTTTISLNSAPPCPPVTGVRPPKFLRPPRAGREPRRSFFAPYCRGSAARTPRLVGGVEGRIEKAHLPTGKPHPAGGALLRRAAAARRNRR